MLGARVTIRSTRTLGALLADGQITPGTQFRLATEPGFTPAGMHATVLEVASQAGMAFGTSPAPVAVAPPPPPRDLPRPPRRTSVPPTPGPREPQAVAPARAPHPPAPPVATPQLASAAWVRQTGRVAAVLAIAFAAGIAAGLIAGEVWHSSVLAWLAAVAAASIGSWFGGRRLARQTPRLTLLQAGAGSAPFVLIGLLIGWPSLIVMAPAGAALWRALQGLRR